MKLQTSIWRHVPNAISLARLAATPVLLFAALAKNQDLFQWLLLACLLSDILDGLVARTFKLQSPLGAFLDSTADLIVGGLGVLGLFLFKIEVLAAHRAPLGLVIALYVIEMMAAFWRYGRISSFHTMLVRVAAYLYGIFVMSVFVWDYVAWIFYAMTIVSVLASTEELVLLWLLPKWQADVRGVYWVMARRRTATS